MKPEITTPEDYHKAWKLSVDSSDDFWINIALTHDWIVRPQTALSGSLESADVRWFEDGQLNLAYNCVDRHLPQLGHKPAIIFEPNDPNQPARTLTYWDLFRQVQHFANGLCSLGVFPGDRVCIYMPMCPEALIAMLACARIGAVHSVVFAGFSANALADRINDSGCKILITADSFFRGTKEIRLKDIADEALLHTPSIRQVVVLPHSGASVSMQAGRDQYWKDLLDQNLPFHFPNQMKAEDPLFILYTSGSTGKPKGIVHTTGGYMVWCGYTFRNVFQTTKDDIFWCTADIGWITGHSYLLYGALLNGLTTVVYEGIPTYPDAGRYWDIIDKHKVSILYTAPTAIRSLIAQGTAPLSGKDLSSLRILGTVGEPINHEAWEWYHTNIGKGKCPIVDTWWQTETGGIMISSFAGVTDQRPTYATLPMPGIVPVLLDEKGNEIPANASETVEGILAIQKPWPGMARTTYGDHERFINTYLTPYKGYYFTGDGARRDPDGFYRITGRVDDVINVSGHRIGTAEVEDVLDEHALVVESAVVGFPHDVKGEALYAYVVCADGSTPDGTFSGELQALVAEKIGAFAKPDKIQIVRALPKTRSGKIMRRILRKLASGDTDNLGDTTTLTDPMVVDEITAGIIR